MAELSIGQLIGQRLIAARGRMSIRELAEKSGVPYETIRRYERGTRDNPSLIVIGRLAAVLNVPMSQIVNFDDYVPDDIEENWPAELATLSV